MTCHTVKNELIALIIYLLSFGKTLTGKGALEGFCVHWYLKYRPTHSYIYLIRINNKKDKTLSRKIFPNIWFCLFRIPTFKNVKVSFTFLFQKSETHDFSIDRYIFKEMDKKLTLTGFPLTSVKNHIFLKNHEKKLLFIIYFFWEIIKINNEIIKPITTLVIVSLFKVPGIKIYWLNDTLVFWINHPEKSAIIPIPVIGIVAYFCF